MFAASIVIVIWAVTLAIFAVGGIGFEFLAVLGISSVLIGVMLLEIYDEHKRKREQQNQTRKVT